MMQPSAFRVLAFRPFVPASWHPWIYFAFIACFQLSGGRYLGALNEMIGSESLMREDLLMCLYANLAGMALYFPLLFRMKFRFTNKTLLTASALVVAVTNIWSAYTSCLPLLWALCFVEGCAKIQGTFECFSNIQLWITPQRDFTVFFPVLHIFILGSITLSDYIAAWLAYYAEWRMMHWLIAGLMVVILGVLHFTTQHARFMRRMPLVGIDWSGWALWNALALEVSALLCYGDWLSWWRSDATWLLCALMLVTLGAALWRMFTVRHPFIEPGIFRVRYVRPILLLIVAVEAIMATEYVLEEVWLEEVMDYGLMAGAQLDIPVFTGCILGCAFSYWWLRVRRLPYVRLIIVGLLAVLAYLVLMYLTLTPAMSRQMFFLPLLSRGFASALLGVVFLLSLHDAMTFPVFFQGLAIYQVLHMVVGGALGGALYARGLSYYVGEGMARYGAWLDGGAWSGLATSGAPLRMDAFMPEFVRQMLAYAIKNVYGWTIYACIALLLGFLLYDSPLRRHARRFPTWREVGRSMWPGRRRPASPGVPSGGR